MKVCLKRIAHCEGTPAKYNMIFNCCSRAEAQRIRNTLPVCMTDSDNDIIVNVIVKFGRAVISPFGCESFGPISLSNLRPVKTSEGCKPKKFCVIVTSNNPRTSQILCRFPKIFICDEDKTIKITFVFNKKRSCRFCSSRNCRSNNRFRSNNGCRVGRRCGCGCGLEWLLLLFLF
ncbi:hypothetical protein [Clostridium gasigenes]|uniref:hypothetical protein n=1 Tax=Clostridium gasigenes TaxID=94869 RepID=UPI001C0BD3C4|nr:hypothetical protein [Clostridium gasigenes]MBU3109409.1 hypothetical protein [Clostridium gasigenes]